MTAHGDTAAVVAAGDGPGDTVGPLELRARIPTRREGGGRGRERDTRDGGIADRLLGPVGRTGLSGPSPRWRLVGGVVLHQRRGLVQSDHGLDRRQRARHRQRRVVRPQRLALNRVVGERGAERRGRLGEATHGLDVLVVVGHVADPEALGLQPRRDGVDVRPGRGERGAVLRGGEELAVLRVAGRGHRGGELLGGVTAAVARGRPGSRPGWSCRTSRPCGRLAPRTGHCPPGRSCRCRVRRRSEEAAPTSAQDTAATPSAANAARVGTDTKPPTGWLEPAACPRSGRQLMAWSFHPGRPVGYP